MSTPTTEILRVRHVLEWLVPIGYSAWQVRVLIETGVIKSYPSLCPLPPAPGKGPKRRYKIYSRRQIARDVLNQTSNTSSGEGPASNGATEKEH